MNTRKLLHAFWTLVLIWGMAWIWTLAGDWQSPFVIALMITTLVLFVGWFAVSFNVYEEGDLDPITWTVWKVWRLL